MEEIVYFPFRIDPQRKNRWLQLVIAAVIFVSIGTGGVIWWTAKSYPENPSSESTVLAGTEMAPNASGRARVRRTPSGFEITLKMHGVPPSKENEYYQGWIKGKKGAVTVGTFHLRNGEDEVTLWSGVEISRYPTIAVTLQEEGDGPHSSGKVIATGLLNQEIN
ncbi:anti-sigma factor [Streptomyces sp. NPDC096153]|uniref:anti-sigma factor domain-containing protein n=1 Tax=Streptomyces sp. NPDC096153 TaxID=3155548 RepID=UPI003319E1A0